MAQRRASRRLQQLPAFTIAEILAEERPDTVMLLDHVPAGRTAYFADYMDVMRGLRRRARQQQNEEYDDGGGGDDYDDYGGDDQGVHLYPPGADLPMERDFVGKPLQEQANALRPFLNAKGKPNLRAKARRGYLAYLKATAIADTDGGVAGCSFCKRPLTQVLNIGLSQRDPLQRWEFDHIMPRELGRAGPSGISPQFVISGSDAGRRSYELVRSHCLEDTRLLCATCHKRLSRMRGELQAESGMALEEFFGLGQIIDMGAHGRRSAAQLWAGDIAAGRYVQR